MSLFSTHSRPLVFEGFLLVGRLWQDRRRRKAASDSLRQIVARSDDHLLQDVGIDRETAHRLLGETMVVPHRAWDRWQG